MEHKKHLGEFLHYTFMNIIGMIGLSCYILADTFFVSKGLGANGLTALNLAIPVYSFLHGCGLMTGMGGATRYSICRGQKAEKSAEIIFTNALYIGGVLAAVFFLAGLFFPGQIAGWLGADAKVYEMTKTYLRVIMLFAPAFILNDILICFVRNDGSPRLSMIAMLAGSFSNIFLDYVFIFPMKMGIFGAVFATGLAPVISIFVLSRHFIRRKNHFHPVKAGLNPKCIKKVIQLGFPSLIAEVASGIVMIIFNMIILNLQGNVGVAAYGVIANLSLVMTSIFTGIAQGMQPLVSRAYGKGDKQTIKQIYHYAVVTMAVIAILTYAAFFGAAEGIVDIFNSEHNRQMSEIAVIGLRLYFTAIPFMGYNIITAIFFSSTQKAKSAQAVALLRGIVLVIPVAFLMAHLAGLYGVWLALTVTEAVVAVFALCMFSVKQ